MNPRLRVIQRIGDGLVDSFHYLALFGIGATIVWSAIHDYLQMMEAGHATLEQILRNGSDPYAPTAGIPGKAGSISP